ncbi:MAG TPA: hypothetical protein VK118_04040 [Tetragenococcus sp.]|nr:hypothetical protein [Tetragenococcus sp.]
MSQVEEIQIGERYKVQPSYFHRAFIGRAKSIKDHSIIFEIENSELCDRDKINDDHLITVELADVKYALKNNYFFS